MALNINPKVTDDDVENVINEAYEAEDSGSRWPGMSYEQGVIAALEWIAGDREENPFEEN